MKGHVLGTAFHILLFVTLVKMESTSIISTPTAVVNTAVESTTLIIGTSDVAPSSVSIEPTQTVSAAESMVAMSSENNVASPSLSVPEIMSNYTESVSQTSDVMVMTSSMTSSVTSYQIVSSMDSTSVMVVASSTVTPEMDFQNSSSATIMPPVSQTLNPENTVIATSSADNYSMSSLPMMSSVSINMSGDVVSTMYTPGSVMPTSVFDSGLNFSSLMPSYDSNMSLSTNVMTTMIDEYSSQSMIQPSSTQTPDIAPSSAQSPDMTSSATPAAPTQAPTTTTTSATAPKPGNKEDAVFAVQGNVLMDKCEDGKTVKETLTGWFKDVLGFQSLRVIRSELKCNNKRRKRDTSTGKSVDYELRLLASNVVNNGTEVEKDINKTLNELKAKGNITSSSGLLESLKKATDSGYCGAEGYCDQGFTCGKDKNDGNCYNWCYSKEFGVICKNDGVCVVEFDFITKELKSKCRCTSTDYYTYEGDNCDTEKMTWRLIVAITGGVAGAIIIILLFIIIIVCVRSKRNDYDSEDYSPINGEVRMQNYKGNRRSDVHNYMRSDFPPYHEEQQMYDNKAYDMPDNDSDMVYRQNTSSADGHGKNWDPAQSANIYAKLNSTFEDSSFQNNIKRPRVSSTKNNADGVTGF